MLSSQLYDVLNEANSAKVIMPHGFIGFDEYRHFIITPFFDDQSDNSFWVLKSLDHPEVSFVLLSINPWDQGDIILKQEDLEGCCTNLGIKIDEICIFLVVSYHEKAGKEKITVNVASPLIYHTLTRQAWQVVLQNSDYPINLDISGSLKNYLGI